MVLVLIQPEAPLPIPTEVCQANFLWLFQCPSQGVSVAGVSCLCCREALLAEMGVALREDGGTVGVFSPKKVSTVCQRAAT